MPNSRAAIPIRIDRRPSKATTGGASNGFWSKVNQLCVTRLCTFGGRVGNGVEERDDTMQEGGSRIAIKDGAKAEGGVGVGDIWWRRGGSGKTISTALARFECGGGGKRRAVFVMGERQRQVSGGWTEESLLRTESCHPRVVGTIVLGSGEGFRRLDGSEAAKTGWALGENVVPNNGERAVDSEGRHWRRCSAGVNNGGGEVKLRELRVRFGGLSKVERRQGKQGRNDRLAMSRAMSRSRTMKVRRGGDLDDLRAMGRVSGRWDCCAGPDRSVIPPNSRAPIRLFTFKPDFES
ncbi:hypothetical protein R3P38DRAFT_2802321 [Favolaschia claudopus]|uniref:Uncharacterized protein n=1 Tax=Favolaschia claudopus TaxID=2862362 RepID=A0AAV9ZUN7_9AGAR